MLQVMLDVESHFHQLECIISELSDYSTRINEYEIACRVQNK